MIPCHNRPGDILIIAVGQGNWVQANRSQGLSPLRQAKAVGFIVKDRQLLRQRDLHFRPFFKD